MWYKNIAGRFFGLVTKHACDRRTDGQTLKTALDRQCTAWKEVLSCQCFMSEIAIFVGHRCAFWSTASWQAASRIWFYPLKSWDMVSIYSLQLYSRTSVVHFQRLRSRLRHWMPDFVYSSCQSLSQTGTRLQTLSSSHYYSPEMINDMQRRAIPLQQLFLDLTIRCNCDRLYRRPILFARSLGPTSVWHMKCLYIIDLYYPQLRGIATK